MQIIRILVSHIFEITAVSMTLYGLYKGWRISKWTRSFMYLMYFFSCIMITSYVMDNRENSFLWFIGKVMPIASIVFLFFTIRSLFSKK